MKSIRYACPAWCTAPDHERQGAYDNEFSEPVHTRSTGRIPMTAGPFWRDNVEVVIQGIDSDPLERDIAVVGMVEALTAGQAEQLAGMLTMAARALRRIEAGEDPDNDDGAQVVTLPTAMATSRALSEAWRRDMTVQGLSDRTITDRVKVVTAMGSAHGCAPETLTADQVAEWLARDGLSRATRGTYAATARAWFGWLTRTKRRTDNPMDELPVPRVPAGEPRPADTDAIRRALASGVWESTRAMFLLGAYAGLRAAEIAAVRGEDVDTAGGRLWVVGKGGRRASVPLHPALAEIAGSMPASGWWFPSPADASRHVSRTSVSAVISRAFTRVGSDATAHALRHWYASQLLAAGASVREVQVMMRHTSLQHTARYMAVEPQRLAQSALALPNLS